MFDGYRIKSKIMTSVEKLFYMIWYHNQEHRQIIFPEGSKTWFIPSMITSCSPGTIQRGVFSLFSSATSPSLVQGLASSGVWNRKDAKENPCAAKIRRMTEI